VRIELQRVEPDAGEPLGYEARVLARAQINSGTTPTGEQILMSVFGHARATLVVIDWTK
jgi:hypothetical protein